MLEKENATTETVAVSTSTPPKRQSAALFATGCVAICLLVGLPLAVVLLSGHRKTPEDLRELFSHYESEFNQLSAVLAEEGRNISVYRDLSAGEHFPLTHDYETLDNPTRQKLIGLIQSAGIRGSYLDCQPGGASTRISIFPDGYVSNGVATYYVFSSSEPDAIVDELPGEHLLLEEGAAVYWRLSGNWYVCVERLDLDYD